MKNRVVYLLTALILTTSACNLDGTPAPATAKPTASSTSLPYTETLTSIPTLPETFAPTSTAIPFTAETPTQTSIPTVENLKAKVMAEKLSCRYGPGAEYLYLYALNQNANIKLIGRTDANNWVWVDGTNKCWVNAKYLEIAGDPKNLPIVYPGLKLPVSPYYPGPKWANAKREGNKVIIDWEEVRISPGKYESDSMHQYIVEVWRCEAGQNIFETLGTNFPFITIENDETGCATPSYGLVYVQEKHGYGGPVEVPWPLHEGQ